MKTKQQVVTEFRRARIVDAARSVFARKGFAQGIMDEIAQQVGIAKGTIYLYFRSKQEIYRAVLEHDMAQLSQSTLERMAAEPELRGKINAFILTRLENAEQQKEFFRIMDRDSGGLALTRSQYHAWLRVPAQHLAAAIEAAADRGGIRQVSSEKVAWLIVDMTRGMIQRRLIGQATASAAEDAGFLSGFIWAALAPVAEAAICK